MAFKQYFNDMMHCVLCRNKMYLRARYLWQCVYCGIIFINKILKKKKNENNRF